MISTSRHVTQGIVDVVREAWDADSRTLRGTSRVVANDPYELRILVPNEAGWQVTVAKASGGGAKLDAAVTTAGELVRVEFESPTSQEVEWSVRFE